MTEPIIRDEWVERTAKAAHWFRCCTVGEWHKGPSDADRKLVIYVLTAVIDDIRAEALREMGDWFQLASQLGTGERDDIAAQACYDRADRIGGRHE